MAAANLKVADTIVDNVNLQRFKLQMEDNIMYIDYELSGNNTYHLVESLVPKEYLGKVLAWMGFPSE